MGSSPSRAATSERKGKPKQCSVSASGQSVDSLRSCSLHLDGVIEMESISACFDDEELNKERPVTVPSVQPEDTRNDSSQSSLNQDDVQKRSPEPTDTVFSQNRHIFCTEKKLKSDHILPPINTGSSSIPNQTHLPEVKKPYGFSSLGDSDILNMKNRSEPIWPVNLQQKSMKNITEQAKIIDDLNREGLIGREITPQVGVAKDRNGGLGYTLTFDTPKRQLPRLLPITSQKKQEFATNRPPWEREILFSENGNFKIKDSNVPRDSCTNSEKLKLKMLNLDLM